MLRAGIQVMEALDAATLVLPELSVGRGMAALHRHLGLHDSAFIGRIPPGTGDTGGPLGIALRPGDGSYFLLTLLPLYLVVLQ